MAEMNEYCEDMAEAVHMGRCESWEEMDSMNANTSDWPEGGDRARVAESEVVSAASVESEDMDLASFFDGFDNRPLTDSEIDYIERELNFDLNSVEMEATADRADRADTAHIDGPIETENEPQGVDLRQVVSHVNSGDDPIESHDSQMAHNDSNESKANVPLCLPSTSGQQTIAYKIITFKVYKQNTCVFIPLGESEEYKIAVPIRDGQSAPKQTQTQSQPLIKEEPKSESESECDSESESESEPECKPSVVSRKRGRPAERTTGPSEPKRPRGRPPYSIEVREEKKKERERKASRKYRLKLKTRKQAMQTMDTIEAYDNNNLSQTVDALNNNIMDLIEMMDNWFNNYEGFTDEERERYIQIRSKHMDDNNN